MKPSITVVGAGRVGSALACSLNCRGYPLSGIVSRSAQSAQNLARRFSAWAEGITLSGEKDIIHQADVVFITVPDDFIAGETVRIAAAKGFRSGQCVLHTSGACTTDVLHAAKDSGAFIGSMHPLQSFADSEMAEANLPGSFFALDGQEEAVAIAREIVADLGGRSLLVAGQHRAIYHTAACIASNYLVALVHCATDLLGEIGLPPAEALQALQPLVAGTLANIEAKGTTGALTGPISRGDISTVARHLDALKRLGGQREQLYSNLGSYTVDIALEKGTINEWQAGQLNQLLKNR